MNQTVLACNVCMLSAPLEFKISIQNKGRQPARDKRTSQGRQDRTGSSTAEFAVKVIAIFGQKTGNIRAKPLDFRASNGEKTIFRQETSAPPPPPPRKSPRTPLILTHVYTTTMLVFLGFVFEN